MTYVCHGLLPCDRALFAYMLALRLQAHRPFSKLSITQIMRKLRRDHDLKDLLTTHFHLPILAI